jgi:hypothetical protein
MENQKIADDEINKLVESLTIVKDYLEGILRGEDLDAGSSINENERYSRIERHWELGKHSK